MEGKPAEQGFGRSLVTSEVVPEIIGNILKVFRRLSPIVEDSCLCWGLFILPYIMGVCSSYMFIVLFIAVFYFPFLLCSLRESVFVEDMLEAEEGFFQAGQNRTSSSAERAAGVAMGSPLGRAKDNFQALFRQGLYRKAFLSIR